MFSDPQGTKVTTAWHQKIPPAITPANHSLGSHWNKLSGQAFQTWRSAPDERRGGFRDRQILSARRGETPVYLQQAKATALRVNHLPVIVAQIKALEFPREVINCRGPNLLSLRRRALFELAPRMLDRRGACRLAPQQHGDGGNEDPQVESEGGIPDVPNVQSGFVRGRQPSPAIDLGPAGQPGSHEQPRGITLRLVDRQERPGADKRHVAQQYVEELWQLVQTQPSQVPTNG